MLITRRQEVVLSYLTGLAPVGSPVVYRTREASEDLSMDRRYIHQDVRRLADVKALDVVEVGRPYFPSTVRVLKRPEQMEVM